MNVRKMGCDELRETIEKLGRRASNLNPAEKDFLNACRKELAKRWGVKL